MNGKRRLYIDQYGHRYWANTVRSLCEQVGHTTARTMYRDKKDGRTVRAGYVIGQYWLDRFTPDELPA